MQYFTKCVRVREQQTWVYSTKEQQGILNATHLVALKFFNPATLQLMDCHSSEGHADRVLALSVTQKALGVIPGHSNILLIWGFFGSGGKSSHFLSTKIACILKKVCLASVVATLWMFSGHQIFQDFFFLDLSTALCH